MTVGSEMTRHGESAGPPGDAVWVGDDGSEPAVGTTIRPPCRRAAGSGQTRSSLPRFWARHARRYSPAASEPAQAESGEPARLLELAEDRLDDGLAAGVASALQRVEIAVADSRRRCSSCGREPTSELTT